MIFEAKGDILKDEDAVVIVHCCNCFHTMGAGLALKIKNKYPGAYKADCDTPYGDNRKMGNFSYFFAKDGKIIVNLYAQYRYGSDKPHFCSQSFIKGLQKLKGFLKMIFKHPNKYPVIGVPKFIGCGLAGGNWEEVREILNLEFSDSSEFRLKIVDFQT